MSSNAPTTSLDPVYTATANGGGDQIALGDQHAPGTSACQSEYLQYMSEDPAFVREAFEAMQPTGCLDTDMQKFASN